METTLEWIACGNNQWLGIEYYPVENPSAPAVCIIHGFRAWHRWGFFPHLAATFQSHGIAAYVLALPSSGYGPPGSFSAAQFARATISQDRVALALAISRLRQQTSCLAALGHSRGGLVALLEHRLFDCMILWTPPRRFGRWTEHQRHRWRSAGVLPAGTHPETGEALVLGIEYLQDLESQPHNADLEQALKTMRIPTCVIAAECDMVAPASEAAALYNALTTPLRLWHVVPHTGHTFGVQHPFHQSTPALEEAIHITLDFFRSCCPCSGNFATSAQQHGER
ncbi:MAG: hypothetical protein RMK00_08425 [Bacteroidota bacterium]|nr:hypothetical protein [Candidatus Kapabacteria bacterium]MCS7302920.1 hypothetical protein [Candidatus Kapabacteria bacterium]MDW8075785.1 hypothetical protein [Bacteroidota bacterium]